MKMQPEDIQLLVRVLRALRGWSQGELGARAGLCGRTIQRYENGDKVPGGTLERLIEATGLPVEVVKSFLAPVLRLLRQLMTAEADGEQASRFAGWEEELALGDEALLEDLKIARGAALSVLAAGMAAVESTGDADRGQAAADGARFPTLTERLCDASVRAAAHRAAEAVELARMAMQAAAKAEGSEAWRTRLRGWARAFLMNALRVSGQLRQAEVELREAWALWKAGEDGDPEGVLPEWRLLDLEASLRRDQLRPGEALALLERARRAAPPEAAGRLLSSTASALEQAGDFAGALRVVREAALALGDGGELRERFGVAFILVANLCHLGRFEEAREGLVEVRRLVRGQGNELDGLRVVWLGARVDEGLGRHEEARAGLVEVRDELARSRDAVDAAVVSLELAVMDLAAGRTAEVKAMAEEMAWIFSSEGIERDTLAALRLFCEAAMREQATVEQARLVLARLERPGVGRGMGGR